MLAGEMKPDGGAVTRSRGLKIGYLAQIPTFEPGQTVSEAVMSVVDLDQGWEAMGAAEEAMSRLGLKSRVNSIEDQLVSTLSGGLQKKVALARELAKKPDLLLLDEPTNHLDLESILWLEEFIKNAKMAVMTISHDRAFLANIGKRVIEVDRRNPNGILSVDGDYDQFLLTKETYLANMAARKDSMENTLRREMEWLRRGAKARTTKQKARIDRTHALADETAVLREKSRDLRVKLEFQADENGPKRLIEAEKISKAYGDKTLFTDLNITLTQRSRIGLIGRNGIGKSSLIRILTGMEEPDSGIVKRSQRLEVAYFEQNRDSLDKSVSVLRAICPYGETVEFQGRGIHVRSYLERFLFDARQAELPVAKLSGGEQSRLLLAKLMLEPANMLVLDEPTNDLDIQTLSILEDCLEEFPGAVILVSHDRSIMNNVCDKFLGFPEMIMYADMDQWQTEWKRRAKAGSEKGGKTPSIERSSSLPPAAAAPASSETSGSVKKRKLSFKEQKEFETMEKTIHAKEADLEKLGQESQAPDVQRNAKKLTELMQKMSIIQSEIDKLYARWSELEALGG
ncbi:MAG: ABC-F family ATP-binding cassette domain-containing protein [Cryobacterium sp.]|nr:ABC-F family ATP-binding cassette domain-containing protein [Oligoflexia bacterium]